MLLRPDFHRAERARALWALELEGIASELEREGLAAFEQAYARILDSVDAMSARPRQAA